MGKYLFVLAGEVDGDPLARTPTRPIFDYQQFVHATGADLTTLSEVNAPPLPLGEGAKVKLRRLRLSQMVVRRAAKYDAIFTSGEDIGIFIALAMRLTGARTPLVIVTHGPLFVSPKFRLLLSFVRGMPNVVWACLSASLADWLVKEHGLDPKRCLPTGYGVDVDFFASEEAPTEPIVASAGTSNRDYETLIAAVGEGVDTRIAAHSFWDGVSPDLARPRPPNVEMRSYGDYANLRELYRAARVVVVPTFDRPYACGFAVAAEAMAMGRPLIVPRTRVVSDYVVEGETGFYYTPGDAGELRARIQQLLDDPDLAARLGREGARRMRENYSLPAYVDRLMEAAQAAGSSPRPQRG